jgi:hypothetical protein
MRVARWLIALVCSAALPDAARAEDCMSRYVTGQQMDQKSALLDAVDCLQREIESLRSDLARAAVPRLRIADPVPQDLGEWIQLPSDGFLQVRVAGATADAWCGPSPDRGGNRILGIHGSTSDILIVPAGSWCRVDVRKANAQGSGVTAWFYALAEGQQSN